MAIAPEAHHYETGPVGRLARDPSLHPSTDELEAMVSYDPHAALLERVFAEPEADILSYGQSKLEKAKIIGAKLREFPAFANYARLHGIDTDTPPNHPCNPFQKPEDAIDVGIAYASTEDRAMSYFRNPQFFEYLNEDEVSNLRTLKDRGQIAEQIQQTEEYFTDGFSVKLQKYLELQSNSDLMGWIQQVSPAAAESLNAGGSQSLRQNLILIESLTKNYYHEQKEAQRRLDQQTEETRKVIEQESVQAKLEAKQSDKLLNLLTEHGNAFDTYLSNRKKHPINACDLIETGSITDVYNLLEKEYQSKAYQKHLKGLPTDGPSFSNLPTNPTKAGRIHKINESDEQSRAIGLVYKVQKPTVTAELALEAIQERTDVLTTRFTAITQKRLADADSATAYLENLKRGVQKATPQQLATVAITSLAMLGLSNNFSPDSNSGPKTDKKAMVQPNTTPGIAPAVAANLDPSLTGGTTVAAGSELQKAIQSFESLPKNTKLTKENKPTAIAWAIETTRALTASKSAALSNREPSLEAKPGSKRGVELIDQVTLLSLNHMTSGSMKKSEIQELTEELSRITLLARHPNTIHKLLVDKNLNKINLNSQFEEDLASLISNKLLRNSKEYTDVQKRLIGRMLAQSMGNSLSPNKRRDVLQDFRVKVTMLNPPPPKAERAPTPRNQNIGFHKVSPKVGYGMSKKAREIYKQILIDAGEKFNVDPNFLAAFYYIEQARTGDSTNNANSAAGTPVTGNGKTREPAAPYGKGAPYRTSTAAAGGPQQFIPATWAAYGVDANGDGEKDRQDLKDAVYGAANYLAANGGTIGASHSDLTAAAWHYNQNHTYVRSAMNTYYYFKGAQNEANAHVKKLRARHAQAAKTPKTPPASTPAPTPPAIAVVQPPVEAAVPTVSMNPNAVISSIINATRNVREEAKPSKQDKLLAKIEARSALLKDIAEQAYHEYKKNGNKKLELKTNWGPAIKEYTGGPQGPAYPWCAYFVSYVYEKAGYKFEGNPAPANGRISHVNGLTAWFKNHGIHFTAASDALSPRPGDVVMYGGDHTGIVIKVKGDIITTIEGNTSGNGTYNADGGTVGLKTYNYKKHAYTSNMGFGRPKDPTL